MGPLFLALSILFNTVANGFFKGAALVSGASTRKYLLLGIGLALGLVNTLCYLKAIETLRLGTAYAVFAAASTVLIALVSAWYFNETISLQKAAGLGVICLGLLLLWGTS